MRPSSWLKLLFSYICLAALKAEPSSELLYPEVKTPEALLRGSLPPFNTAEEAKAKTCELAARPLPSVLPLLLFDNDRLALMTYKDAWLNICQNTGSSALAEAFQLGLDLERMLREPIFRHDLPSPETSELEEDRKDLIYQRLDALDTVVPAFYGTAEGFEYYAPNWTLFYLAALVGSAEDQQFFRMHYQLRRHPLIYPWMEAASDLGVCIQFGEYPWLKVLRELQEVLSAVQHPIYIRALQEWRAALLGVFEAPAEKPQICACRVDIEEVQQDGDGLLKFLEQKEELRAEHDRLKQALERLRKQKKIVRNYSEQGCAY